MLGLMNVGCRILKFLLALDRRSTSGGTAFSRLVSLSLDERLGLIEVALAETELVVGAFQIFAHIFKFFNEIVETQVVHFYDYNY